VFFSSLHPNGKILNELKIRSRTKPMDELCAIIIIGIVYVLVMNTSEQVRILLAVAVVIGGAFKICYKKIETLLRQK